ncbi:Uncharacterised protein [Bordetella pertussis]|nr:Uncharacterised protein [Bordetella pertussis]
MRGEGGAIGGVAIGAVDIGAAFGGEGGGLRAPVGGIVQGHGSRMRAGPAARRRAG